MLDNSKTTMLRDLEPFIILIEIFMKFNGLMIKLMAKEHTATPIDKDMLASGKLISRMD